MICLILELEYHLVLNLTHFCVLSIRNFFGYGTHQIIHGFSTSTVVELCLFGMLGGVLSCLNGADMGLPFLVFLTLYYRVDRARGILTAMPYVCCSLLSA